MSNQPKAMQDPAMKQYFDTLPTSVQETIVQSGVEVNSVEPVSYTHLDVYKRQAEGMAGINRLALFKAHRPGRLRPQLPPCLPVQPFQKEQAVGGLPHRGGKRDLLHTVPPKLSHMGQLQN